MEKGTLSQLVRLKDASNAVVVPSASLYHLGVNLPMEFSSLIGLLLSAILAAAFACLGLYALATGDGGHASHAAVLSLGFAAIAAYWLLAAGRLRRGED